MPITDQERYLFDLRGYTVLEPQLSADEIAELRKVIDANYSPAPLLSQDNCYCEFLHWGGKLLDLMVHPAVMEWVEELCDKNPRLDHAYFYHMRNGEPEPLGMHGGGYRINHSEYFYFKNGKMHNGLIVVAWSLVDAAPGEGGFCCVPGSHKANYDFAAVHDCSKYEEPIVQVPVRAGSVIIFTEALTHGTMPWRAPHERYALFYKYAPKAGVWSAWTPDKWNDVKQRVPRDWPAEKRVIAEQLFGPPCISAATY